MPSLTSWAWKDENGAYFLPIKYGRQRIELKKGMLSTVCDDLEHVASALSALQTMSLKGDLYDQLVKASTDIRIRFANVRTEK